MNGVTFGTYHSYDDFSLILTSKEIAAPKTKTVKIDVEGADGAIDLTEFFGEPKYEDCTHKFQFSTIVPQSQFLTLFSDIKNKIHGKKLRISLDADPGFYYMGRCFVSAFTNEKNVGKISVECECEPYKYKLNPTVVQRTISGSGTVNLVNSRKRAVPTIKTTATFTIAFGGFSTSRSAGTFTVPEFELSAGSNTFTVTGTGTITFTYQEGAL